MPNGTAKIPPRRSTMFSQPIFNEEQQDYAQTVQAVQEAYEDVKAGRTRPAAEFLEDLRMKHGLPR